MKRWKNLIVAGLVSTLALGAIAAVPTVVTYVGAIRGWVYVDDFGAKPNGVDDATQAYTDAVNLLKRMHGGGKVHFGSGVYKLLNAPLVEGVSIHGVGMRSGFGSKGVTTLKHGDPTAGGSMFRVTCEGTTAKGYTDLDITINASTDVITTSANHNWTAGQPVKLYAKNGPMPSGASEITVLYAGEATNGAGLSGNTLRLYGTQAQAQAGGATGVNDFTTAGFVFTGATTDVCTSNPHPFKPGDAVRLTTTNTLPAGLSTGTTYYVGRPGGTNFYLYTSSVNAISGGATGLVDITDTGTGTHSVARYPEGATLGLRGIADLPFGQFFGGGIFDCELDGGANGGLAAVPTALQTNQSIGIDFGGVSLLADWHIERCYFKNWDVAVRDGMLGTTGLCVLNCEARYNFCAFNIGEQPLCCYNTVNNNYYAFAGRFVDATFLGQYMGDNYVCISGYLGYTGRWAGCSSPISNASVTNCTFTGCVFFGSKIVGLALNGNNTVSSCQFVGYNTDTSDGGSTGIRVYGDGNKVATSFFGEGTAATSFYRAAILADTANSSTLVDNLITGNTFYLAACPAIQGGNSQTGVYGSGAYGTVNQWTVNGNTFRMLSHRAIDLRTTTGTASYWQIVGNRITNLPGGADGATAALATTDALVEGAMRYYLLSANYFHKNGGLSTARGFTSSWGSAQSGQVFGNRFDGWTSTNQNINIAAGGGDALTALDHNWLSGGGISVGATDNTLKRDNIGP